jgi:hypothetical protein
MEQILNFEIISGSVIPALAVLINLAGYLVTDKLYLHLSFSTNKATAVAVTAIPLAFIYWITGSAWESVLITYFAAVTAYDLLLKNLKP